MIASLHKESNHTYTLSSAKHRERHLLQSVVNNYAAQVICLKSIKKFPNQTPLQYFNLKRFLCSNIVLKPTNGINL
ncbi:hypothetical protein DOY81_004300 [Sarcophaga bullata]|nr:hypothetical protein DOY81_004300 [Sarcophaga bullata]